MQTRQVTIQCEGGLHLRVAARVVKQMQHHQSAVHIRCQDCPRANACSIFELLKLGATPGTSLEVTAEGPDEEAILQALCEIFDEGAGI